MNHTFRIFKRGYTLVELMVAISILALLFAAGVTSYSKATQRSRDATRKSDLEHVRSALEMYRADTANYPSMGCTDSCSSSYQIDSTNLGELEGYLAKFPLDPMGTYYMYRPMNIVSPKAYGYCLYASVEGTENDLLECVNISNYNYEVKNP